MAVLLNVIKFCNYYHHLVTISTGRPGHFFARHRLEGVYFVRIFNFAKNNFTIHLHNYTKISVTYFEYVALCKSFSIY